MNSTDLNVINSYIQIALLVVQSLSLIALILYVIKTWEMASATKKSSETAEKTLREMSDTREDEAAPYIVVYFDKSPEQSGFFLVIKNVGKTMAENVRLSFDPPLQAKEEVMPLLRNFLPQSGLASLPPNYELRTGMGFFRDYRRLGFPMKYTVTVIYQGGITQTARKVVYNLDLTPFIGLSYFEEAETNQVAKVLEKINATNLSLFSKQSKVIKKGRNRNV